MLKEEERAVIVAEVIQTVEDRLIERGDERYVLQNVCVDRQGKINKKFANDDKRIDVLTHRFNTWDKLLWVIATACASALVVEIINLIRG